MGVLGKGRLSYLTIAEESWDGSGHENSLPECCIKEQRTL